MMAFLFQLAFGSPPSADTLQLSVILLAGLVGLGVSGSISLVHELRLEREQKKALDVLARTDKSA